MQPQVYTERLTSCIRLMMEMRRRKTNEGVSLLKKMMMVVNVELEGGKKQREWR